MSKSIAGGAMNVGNFREELERGRLPAVSTVTHGGLFREYYFPIGPQTTKVFDANLHAAVSPDPFSKKLEHFVSIGLNSKYDGEGLKKLGGRPPLNLVILIDISGSMDARLDHQSSDKKTKLDLAKDSCNTLLTMLKPQDRLCITSFDSKVYVNVPFSDVSKLDLENTKQIISNMRAQGSTDLSLGIKESGAQFKISNINVADTSYENRILVLTDANPTSGDMSEDGLLKIMKTLASDRIFVSFIGMGVDFGSELAEGISRVPGGLYLTVNTNAEFSKMMHEDFDYLMTPIVHDFLVEFGDASTTLLRVYGDGMSENNAGSLEIISGSSMMPSDFNEAKGTKGGIILLSVANLDQNHPLKLRLRYSDREHAKYDEFAVMSAEDLAGSTEKYQMLGVRKAILLTRYVNFMQTILQALHDGLPVPDMSNGIPVPPPLKPKVDSQETSSRRRAPSNPINVDAGYVALLKQFVTYFETEVDQIGDPSLTKELKLLDTVISLHKP